ncbi:peptidase [Porphyromonas crevioricanis]|uniref:dipeptidase E n=2 Tax=Porphyromonas crevioricanis TaxID=393921 RepID=A0A0A2FFV7_9PORP|nr:dipeptidase PepE [Porphyromonas crevioricanis]KGN88905.1 peptidase [Porphyromonas crevioricanis]KGN95821.1 peptidase [Porphyromonas crevioricanis]SJZ74427.1 dipeptidase E [Porphyromonas crevioricanis]SQH73451.1 Peptidase E [Porphyromonas crevioricanis]GAD04924.1 alpha-aspartyl dipeptidase Peptidase E [Porphyromonas crevioricanis JCM 15906]
MRLLLISNSASPGEGYLEKASEHICEFLGNRPLNIVFIPFAAVTYTYDEYEEKVNKRFSSFGQRVVSIHRAQRPIDAVTRADAIVVGGGNTFILVKKMQEMGLLEAIRERVLGGVPYIGWSAGSNVACPTLCTTNDMPIVQPRSFDVFNFVPFQINPHYLDAHPEGHGGETREQRIAEYLVANPNRWVVGLREGCMLKVEGTQISMQGDKTLRVFRHGKETVELKPGQDLHFLLQ